MVFHSQSAEVVLRHVSGRQTGLTAQEATARLRENGENVLREEKSEGILRQFFSQLKDFSVLILLAAAALSFGISLWSGERDYTDMAVILAIVIVNATIGVAQERRATRALEALKKLASPNAAVLRDGKKCVVPAASLVTGDIILITAGDAIPADARLLSSVSFRVDESALTGESVPAEKDARALCREETPLPERRNMLYASTLAVSGHAEAVVTGTGMQTEIGRIADLLGEKNDETPLQKRLAGLSKILGIGALACCALIFLLGIVRKNNPLDSFLLAVSLAVAAIPEGLPAIVTIVLSRGVGILSRHGAIIRHLRASETLGNATFICSDKTGTLTQNRMTVTKLWVPGSTLLPPESSQGKELLCTAALCTNCTVSRRRGKPGVVGEPTEAALVKAALEAGFREKEAHALYARVREIPFSSEKKSMTTVHRDANRYLRVMKGAPQTVLSHCTHFMNGGIPRPLTASLKASFERANETMAKEALRVLAIAAARDDTLLPNSEEGLCLLGLVGMEDPPRPEVKEAVKICRDAGITPMMITGDQLSTAKVIAERLGILKSDGVAVTGAALDSMEEDTLKREVGKIQVVARAAPEHKMRLVRALQANGETVAMTGDGINDAPALSAADIGCAMGKSGTDVAKNASDLILTDDNFTTIVKAVEIGRGLFDNIRKAVRFLLSCNIGEILLIFAASLFGFPTPLLPVQLLWLNLVTDSLPTMALGAERPERDIMKRLPLKKGEGILTKTAAWDIALEGCLFGAISLVAFVLGSRLYSLEVGRTMAFCVLSLSEVFHAFNVRTTHSVFTVSPFENPLLLLSTFLCAFLQIAVVIVPWASAVFRTVPLTRQQWLTVASLCLIPLLVTEAEKLLAAWQARPARKQKAAKRPKTAQDPQ